MSQFFIESTAGNLPPSVAQSFVTSPAIGEAIPALGVITFVDGNGIVFSASGSSITASVVSDGFLWEDKSADFQAQVQRGYFCTGVITANLPAAPAQGDSIIIYVDSASAVTIQTSGTQTIQIGAGQSTAGGTATSTAEGSTLTLVYRLSDNEFHAISEIGASWSLA
jgi:hypothetical protein